MAQQRRQRRLEAIENKRAELEGLLARNAHAAQALDHAIETRDVKTVSPFFKTLIEKHRKVMLLMISMRTHQMLFLKIPSASTALAKTQRAQKYSREDLVGYSIALSLSNL